MNCLTFKENVLHIVQVFHAIGIEGFLAAMFVLMVANLRTLNVPIAYSSWPCILAATANGIIITCFKFAIERNFRSKGKKGCLVVLTSFVHYIGAALVILGNVMKLYEDQQQNAAKNSTMLSLSENASLKIMINGNNCSEAVLSPLLQTQQNVTIEFDRLLPIPCPTKVPSEEREGDSILPFPVYGLVAMLGYACLDGGYDSGMFSLKTFALTGTPQDQQAKILVKASSITSIGGAVISFLGTLDTGKWLTAGSDIEYDVNAVSAAFISGIAIIMGVLSLTTTLVSGFFFHRNSQYSADVTVDEEKPWHDDITAGEKARLIFEESDRRGTEEDIHTWSGIVKLEHSMSVSMSMSRSIMDNQGVRHRHRIPRKAIEPVDDGQTNIVVSKLKAMAGTVKRNKFQIVLCSGTFFGGIAIFLFDTYSVNFAGISIYRGDPEAEVGTENYEKFSKGEKAGSTGLLLFYLSSFAAGCFQETILTKIGWWKLMAGTSMAYIAVNVCCVVFLEEWIYFLSSCMTGIYRLCVYTLPFVLVNTMDMKRQQAGDTDSTKLTSDMAVVSLAYPCSFLLAAAFAGPIMAVTGSAATSVYCVIIVTAMGLACFWCIRKY